MIRRNLHRQRGAEIVEFILVLPFILIVFFAVVELGVGFANQAVLANAARAAAREAIRARDDSAELETAVRDVVERSMIAWKTRPDPPDDIVGCDDALPVGGIKVCLFRKEPSTGEAPPWAVTDSCSDGALTGDKVPWVCVTVTHDYRLAGLPAFLSSAATLTLTGRSVMRQLKEP
jgi:hypothetical protein